MGGIFLFKQIIQLVFGFLCGYLFIKWVPFSYQFSFEEILVSFVLKPLKFFGAAVILIIGGILNGELIMILFRLILNGFRNNEYSIFHLVICVGLVINFFVLFKSGIWQSMMLLCFLCYMV